MLRTGLLTSTLALACAAHTQVGKAEPRDAPEYRIGREDVLEIVVWKEPDLTRTVPVRPDGIISLPLAGEVQAAGKTPAELRDELSRSLGRYVRDPAVAVLVREINGSRFSVLGEVTHPGTFPLRGPVSVTQALATAGGLTEFAGDEVVWLRARDRGKPERISLSVKELIGGDADGVLWLGPGDVLYVH